MENYERMQNSRSFSNEARQQLFFNMIFLNIIFAGVFGFFLHLVDLLESKQEGRERVGKDEQ